jgi:hypothetical protein
LDGITVPPELWSAVVSAVFLGWFGPPTNFESSEEFGTLLSPKPRD